MHAAFRWGKANIKQLKLLLLNTAASWHCNGVSGNGEHTSKPANCCSSWLFLVFFIVPAASSVATCRMVGIEGCAIEF